MQTVSKINGVKELMYKIKEKGNCLNFLSQILAIFLFTKLITNIFSVEAVIYQSKSIAYLLNFTSELIITFINWKLALLLIYAYRKTDKTESLFIAVSFLIAGIINLCYIVLAFNNPDAIHGCDCKILLQGTILLITAVLFINWFIKPKEDNDKYYFYLVIIISILTILFLIGVFQSEENLTGIVFQSRILTILLLMSNIVLYIRRFYNRSMEKVDLTLVKVFILLLLGQFLFFSTDTPTSLSYLTAELYKVVGFIYLFRAVLNSDVTAEVFKTDDDKIELALKEDKIKNLRAQRHDFKNQLQTIYTMIQMNKPRRVEEYIQRLQFDLDNFNLESNEIEEDTELEIPPALLAKKEEAEINGVDFNIEVELGLDKFDIPENRFSKVIFNLIDNAFDAVGDLPKERRRVEVKLVDDGEYGQLVVSNPGPEIPESQLDTIFEPGYSTKGEGRGFGLYIVKSIVEEYNGEIEVESSKEEGAKFICWLPK